MFNDTKSLHRSVIGVLLKEAADETEKQDELQNEDASADETEKEVKTEAAATNPAVTELENLQEVIERLDGLINRRPDYRDGVLTSTLRKAAISISSNLERIENLGESTQKDKTKNFIKESYTDEAAHVEATAIKAITATHAVSDANNFSRSAKECTKASQFFAHAVDRVAKDQFQPELESERKHWETFFHAHEVFFEEIAGIHDELSEVQ